MCEIRELESSLDVLPADVPNYLCKWCLTYVGQRRQFCSADCAAQFKLCQKRREQKQNLNISVDYYGNVKLSIQGLPIAPGDDAAASRSWPETGRFGRRRRRCRSCAKLLTVDVEGEFCDEMCQSMETEKNKREEFVNIFQQKEVAERRRIRKWLLDAQDHYTKQTEGAEILLNGEKPDSEILDVTSGPAALNPLPVQRSPLPPVIETARRPKDTQRSGGPPYSFRRHFVHHVPEKFRLRRDEVVTGGPITLNPIPLRRGPLRQTKPREVHSDRRELRIDLGWIPKFDG